jgi:nucleotide-binding universal stress UspA family protein
MARVKRILAPTDFSELSKVGIRYALEMARDVSAEVVVYHAVDVGGQWKDRPPLAAAHHDMLEEIASIWSECAARLNSAHRTRISSRRRLPRAST